MSDLQKFIELYKSVGIELKPDVKINGDIYLHLEEGEHKKFKGYNMFFSEIIFDENGKFISQGFWE